MSTLKRTVSVMEEGARSSSSSVKRAIKKAKRRLRTKALVPYKRDPFPPIWRNINMRYQDAPGYTMSFPGGVSYYNSFSMFPTSLYDYDYSGAIGNKQPLYFDTLFTSQGPYLFYRVKRWKTVITVVNLSTVPVVVYAGHASITGNTVELDTPTEMQNFPDIKKVFLTEKGGEKCIATITLYGDLSKIAPNFKDSDFTGSYNSSPTKNVTQTCLVQAMDGSSGGSCLVTVSHEAVSDLFVRDAVVS